jgi:hypothetical protein
MTSNEENTPLGLSNFKTLENENDAKRSQKRVQDEKSVRDAEEAQVRRESQEDEVRGHEQEEENVLVEPQVETPSEETEGIEGFDKVDEEAEEQDDLDVDLNLKGNLQVPVANLLKNKGYLPEDFEISEDLTEEALEEAMITNYRKKAESSIKAELAKELKQYGVDPNLAELNKIKSYGVTDEELNKLHTYSQLGGLQVDPNDDNIEEIVTNLGKQYFAARDIEESDIQDYIETDLNKYEPQELVDKYGSYFEKQVNNLKVTIDEKIKQGKVAEAERQEKERERLSGILESGNIDGKKFSKEQVDLLKQAFFEKTERIEDDHGNTLRVTRLEKMQHELAKNPEKELRLLADFLLGYDYKAAIETGKTLGKRGFMQDLNNLSRC